MWWVGSSMVTPFDRLMSYNSERRKEMGVLHICASSLRAYVSERRASSSSMPRCGR